MLYLFCLNLTLEVNTTQFTEKYFSRTNKQTDEQRCRQTEREIEVINITENKTNYI